jgi:hypothetical protein
MPIYLLVPLFAGLGYVAWKVKKPMGSMNPRQRIIFQNLLSATNPETSVDTFLKFAALFDREGFRPEADILRKRARIASLPPQAQAKLKMAFQNGLRSNDAVAVRDLANYFEREGFFGFCEKLRDYANHLDTGAAIAAVQAQKHAQAQAAIHSAPIGAVAHAVQTVSPSDITPSGVTPPGAPSGGLSDAEVLAQATPEQLASAKSAIAAKDAFGGATPVITSGAQQAVSAAGSAVQGAVSQIPGVGGAASSAVGAGVTAAGNAVPGAITAAAGQAGQTLGSIFGHDKKKKK